MIVDWLILSLLLVWFILDRFNIYFRHEPEE